MGIGTLEQGVDSSGSGGWMMELIIQVISQFTFYSRRTPIKKEEKRKVGIFIVIDVNKGVALVGSRSYSGVDWLLFTWNSIFCCFFVAILHKVLADEVARKKLDKMIENL